MTIYKHAELSDDLAARLGDTLGDYAEGFRQEIASKVSFLLEFDNPDTQSNYLYIVRPEEQDFVVCCAVGQGADFLQTIATLSDMARGYGYHYIRFHTARRGLSRRLKPFAPKEIERVYKIGV